MQFGFAKLEELDVFWAYFMLVLHFDGVRTFLEASARVRLVYISMDS
jgi:hypothetical protein